MLRLSYPRWALAGCVVSLLVGELLLGLQGSRVIALSVGLGCGWALYWWGPQWAPTLLGDREER